MIKTYYRPQSLDEALKLISNESEKNAPLAGGTTLALNPRGIDGLVDLAGLKLSGIQRPPLGLRIGATTPIREIQRSEPVRQFAGGILAESAKNYLTALIRNRATIGGVLSAGNFWADISTALVALNASLRVMRLGNGGGKPQDVLVPLEEFVQKGPRKSLAGGILAEIQVPTPASGSKFACTRLAKVETDISILSAAVMVTLSGKSVQAVRVVVGTGARPVRLRSIEDRAAGKSIEQIRDAAAQAASEIPAESDIRASADYRRAVAAVLVRRLLQSLT